MIRKRKQKPEVVVFDDTRARFNPVYEAQEPIYEAVSITSENKEVLYDSADEYDARTLPHEYETPVSTPMYAYAQSVPVYSRPTTKC